MPSAGRLGMARIYGQNKGSWLKCHVIIAPLDLERSDIRNESARNPWSTHGYYGYRGSMVSESRYLVPPGGYGRMKGASQGLHVDTVSCTMSEIVLAIHT
jgi:hypothetical protein